MPQSKIIPDIPVKYNVFPENYVNDVLGWGISRNELEQNAGKLLTLDIDFGSRCSLNCPFCFRRENSVDASKKELGLDFLVKLIEEAIPLGLKTIKFLGAGEPLENPGILDFIQILSDQNIISVLFTKTGLIADDAKVSKLFSSHGIICGQELSKYLYDRDVSIVQGFNSFNDQIQCEMAGGNLEVVHRRNQT